MHTCTHNIFRTIHAQLHTNQYKSVYIGVCTLYWHWHWHWHQHCHDSIINIWKWWSVTLSAKWKILSLQRKYHSQHRSHWSGAITSKMDVNTYIMTPIHRYIYCLIESFFFRTSQQIKNENFRKNYAKKKINKRMNSYREKLLIRKLRINWPLWVLDTTQRQGEKMCSVINAWPQWNIVAGIIITLRYYRTWFYYHIMASRGWLAIVFFSVSLAIAYLVYSMHFYNVCLFILFANLIVRERAYSFIQVCSSVENVSIYTIDSSDLNWKLLRSMHILRVLVVFLFVYLFVVGVVVISRCARQPIRAIFNSHIFIPMRYIYVWVFLYVQILRLTAFDCPVHQAYTQGLSDLDFVWIHLKMIRENDPWIRSTISIGFECDSPIHIYWIGRCASNVSRGKDAWKVRSLIITMPGKWLMA